MDLAIIWMEVLGKQINRWILHSISKDMVHAHAYMYIRHVVLLLVCVWYGALIRLCSVLGNLCSLLQWTLLTISTGTSDSDAAFPAIPAQQTAVRPTVRPSPFPSPGYTPVNRTPNTTTVGSIGTNGAFMPYHQLGEERRGGGQRERPMVRERGRDCVCLG